MCKSPDLLHEQPVLGPVVKHFTVNTPMLEKLSHCLNFTTGMKLQIKWYAKSELQILMVAKIKIFINIQLKLLM